MREKIARLIDDNYHGLTHYDNGSRSWCGELADQILSLPVEGFEVKVQTSDHPNGYAIETRPLTLGELLKKAPILIKIAQWANDENDKDCIEFFNCPADESWCKESNCPIDDALTFKGSRIIKKLIPSSDGK